MLPPEITKTWEIAILGVLWGPGNQSGIQCFFMILWISESFSLYLLVKNSFNFKLGFFTYFQYISGGIIRKNILRSDYHSARWHWCKKDQKNFPQTSNKVFSQCLIVNSLFLWTFMVQRFCKNSFSGSESRKNNISVKNHLFCRKSLRITGFHELTSKLLSIFAGLIIHNCVVFNLWDISFHYFIYKLIETTRNNFIKNKERKPWYVFKSSVFKSFQWWSNCSKLKIEFLLVSA